MCASLVVLVWFVVCCFCMLVDRCCYGCGVFAGVVFGLGVGVLAH